MNRLASCTGLMLWRPLPSSWASLAFDTARAVRSAPKSKAQRSLGSPTAAAVSHLVEVSVHGYVGTITMDHYSKRNALSHRLCRAIQDGVDRCCAAGVRVVVLRAMPGARVWSAGHELGRHPQTCN